MQATPLNLRRTSALVALLLVTACASTPSTNIGAAGDAGANGATLAQTDEDPLICEMVIPSGTRIGRKVCIRKSERDRIREQSQLITQENQQRAVIGSPTGN